MKNIKIYLAILSVSLFVFINCDGQNYIYGIHHNGGYYFSKYDISSNTYTDLQAVPSMTSLPGSMSSCIDDINSIYYLCTGTVLFGFDLNNGNLVTNYTLPLPGILGKIQFNSCDTNIYGLLDDFTSIKLARINAAANTMNIIFSQSYPAGFCLGCLGFIDPSNQIYTLYMSAVIMGIDLNTGQVAYYTPVINIPSEDFGHTCLHCNTQTIYGTSADITAGVKYLATIDPITGIVSHVPGSIGWNTGIWKPASAGATIDQLNSVYYYIGVGNLLNGIDLSTGNLQFSQSNIPEMYFIQHSTQCPCLETGLINNIVEADFMITPNPFTDILNITRKKNEPVEINFCDITSRKIFHQSFTNSLSINTAQLAKGIYLYEVRNKNGVIKKGKVVKE